MYHSFISWQSLFLAQLKKSVFFFPVDVIMKSSSSLDHSHHWRQEESKVGRLAWKAVESLNMLTRWRTEGADWVARVHVPVGQLTWLKGRQFGWKGRLSVWLKLTYSKVEQPPGLHQKASLELWHGPLHTCVYSSNTLTYRPSFSSFPLPASSLCVYHALHLPAVSAMPDGGCVYYPVHGPAYNQSRRILWSIWLVCKCVRDWGWGLSVPKH